MMRWSMALLALCLAVAGCSSGDDPEVAPVAGDGTTGPPATMAATATTNSAAVVATSEPVSATTEATLPPIVELEAGLFCRDLKAAGFSYADAVTYWVREGSPDRMDADRDGVPCQTVYAETEVMTFWGDHLPTTTMIPPEAIAAIEEYAEAEWQQATGEVFAWVCWPELGTGLIGGTAWECIPEDIGEGEHPVLTALVLDNRGTVALAQSGTYLPDLTPGLLADRLGPCGLCSDVINPESGLMDWVTDPRHRYFGAVLYWFEEGRPDRMDVNGNGIPCESLFDAGTVEGLWEGGLVGRTSYDAAG